MNILLITPHFSPAIGGVETHLDDLCQYFNGQKYNVYVRTYKAWGVKNRGETEEKRGCIHIHRMWWPDFNLFFRLENYPLMKFLFVGSGILIDSFFFLLQNHKKIDVIQAHGFSAGLISVILGKLFKKRIVINTHVALKLHKSIALKIIKWMLINASKILVLTNGVKNILVGLGVSEDKILVYHYWIDQKIFKFRKNAKRDLGWKDKFIVLFVGRLIDVKGVMKIFDLAKILKKIKFVIIGSGPLEQILKYKSSDYKNIEFIGKVDHANLPVYYSAADILLLPSNTTNQEYEEGIPIVMIEALSCGLPIISTRSGGIPDIFYKGKTIGALIEDNEVSMANMIMKYYQNRILLNKTARNCRKYAEKFFGIKNAYIITKSLNE